ncbi:cysteine hydrolase family protein [Secundilactobacillus collinoides]|uniref:Isochorismatase family protein n=1 Tax=Secundilactobacillus collinoides DSM 20515 = JCM 1123 TaxID=1423733 RepID=A0A0R2B783_SECCO|nr:cysteine hydrolase [Secundilactobacillus collinoides]KRM73796.1 isochorismatase family protein [Secundilactobacillus collinoides DSM 20515 = JCM 1123]
MAANEALLIIDYTNDFVADKGVLTCGKAGQVLDPYIVALADRFENDNSWVILPTDVHTPNDPYHPETKLFPPHNVRGTWGREFYGDVARWFNDHQNDEKVYMYDKTRYSAFAGTDLDIRLRERHVDTLHLTGVCTDICVLHTAVDAYNLGYNIIVHENAVAALTPAGQEWALGHFKGVLGATVTD